MIVSTYIRRLDCALVLWAALVSGALFAGFAHHGFDDPYITFRYATNLASGEGFVYNPGLRILSTTTPLYALLLTPFAARGLPLPLVSMALGALSHALGGLALYTLGRLWQMPLVGIVAALLYPTFPLLISALGGEAAFVIALVLWGFVAAVAGRWYIAAVLLAAAVVTRADALVAVACLGVYALLNGDQHSALPPSASRLPPFSRLPWRAALLGALLCLPWFLFAWWYYGAPTPVTLAVKQLQSAIPGTVGFSAGLRTYAGALAAQPLYSLLLFLATIGFGYALARHRAWLLVIGWSSAYGLAYAALGVPAYFWYYTPLIPGLTVAAGLGVQATHDLLIWVVEMLRQQRSPNHLVTRSPDHPVTASARYAAISMALLLTALLLGSQLWSLADLRAAPDHRLEVYRAAGTWLATHTTPEARIGALEVGIIGYYAERSMIDFAGLIQPEVATQFGPQAGYDTATRWAITQYRPEYLVLSEPALPLELVVPRGAERCREVIAFTNERNPETLRIYQCVW